ncbi:MAG TPA: nuclear transport factor 2 family protein [Xenococcaceae cyanobacterium]|jgi:hypothetical protein
MTHLQTQTEHLITIEGVEAANIINYFTTINQEDFASTASLFAEDGELFAPFEKPIIGRKEIASYLAQEAKGMKLLPQQRVWETTEANLEAVKILGKVQTALFSVNVAWYFNLNLDRQITQAKIKLLASPQELLGLRRGDRSNKSG